MVKSESKINCVFVIGLGRIGLPESLTFANAGVKVYGFDNNPTTIQSLNQGNTSFYEPKMDDYLKDNLNKTFFPIASWDEARSIFKNIDAIILAMGTKAPSFKDVLNDNHLDLAGHFQVLDEIFSNIQLLKKGIKIIIRTTLPLGGTDSIKNHIEKKFNIKEGQEFFLAFAPERVIEGAAISEHHKLPKIIGVYSDPAYEPISALFKSEGGKTIRVKNPITAEFCKLTDNSFRSTIFNYANEIAMFANHFDINAEEVINTVNMDYQRNNIPVPGFVSGYCLTKDPYIFELGFMKNNPQRNFQSIWYYACRAGEYLVEFVVSKVIKKLNNIQNSTVTILGLAFNADVDDFRMSHAFKIIELLVKQGVKKIKVYDPFLEKNHYTQLPEDIMPYIVFKSNQLDESLFTEANAIILCDRHQALKEANNLKTLTDLLKNSEKPCYLYDGWDIWKEALKIDHIQYESIGFKGNE